MFKIKNILAGIVLLAVMPTFAIAQPQNGYYFVFLNSNPNRVELREEQRDSLQKGHLQNIIRLWKTGKLVAAGPFEHGGGIFIFKAGSISEVQDSLQTDPAIRANRFILEVYLMEFITGGTCMVPENAEMVCHNFLRLELKDNPNLDQPPQPRLRLEVLSEQLSKDDWKPIATCWFTGRMEGIVILDPVKQTAGESVAQPFIDEDMWKADVKKLWIAKGVFCE